MENLGRGVVAVNQGGGKVFISWRMLGTDPDNIAFNLYRAVDGAAPAKLNTDPISKVTFYEDSGLDAGKSYAYTVKPVVDGKEQDASKPFLNTIAANAEAKQYFQIPLQLPERTTPNDASVGDVDGDGEYEIILKGEQQPRDTASAGMTGDTVLQCYKIDGKLLWTIHMGRNVREGAHDTQFMVADMDGDGKAELACRTADGTIDGTGKVIGDANADWREPETSPNRGRILKGPEFFTIFDGLTGKELASTAYIPTRDPLNGWGGIGGNGGNDSNGNRANRFLACVAYLDGKLPSVVMCRGYYGRSVLAAWDWRDGKLTSRWVFDSAKEGKGKDGKPLSDYSGMGAHGISVADVDDDGKDEIVYNAMIVDDDGQGLLTTGLRHGDALHVSDLDPDRPGLEVFGPHENEEERTAQFKTPAAAMYSAKTGEILWGFNPNVDAGRGVADDIDPRFGGAEAWWSGSNGLYSAKGEKISERAPQQTNFLVYWDGDPLRELLDGNRVSKWDWTAEQSKPIFVMEGCSSNNGTKSTPALSADLFGDWREEIIERTSDNTALRIYTTTIPTEMRMYTLMHNPQYRDAIAWQNVAYNQPPHLSFLPGGGQTPPKPNIVTTPIP
jgi:rhamnogalacturonan endolyase